MELDQKSPKTTLFLSFLLWKLHNINTVKRKTAKVRNHHRNVAKLRHRLTPSMTSWTESWNWTKNHQKRPYFFHSCFQTFTRLIKYRERQRKLESIIENVTKLCCDLPQVWRVWPIRAGAQTNTLQRHQVTPPTPSMIFHMQTDSINWRCEYSVFTTIVMPVSMWRASGTTILEFLLKFFLLLLQVTQNNW
jgi:hypothetical protein